VRAAENEARTSPTFDIVFVCTANRARSPFAAAVLQRYLDGAPVAVGSFGTMERGGAPALRTAVETARRFGIDLTRHRAEPLPPAALAASALVIGFEQFHVAAAVVTGGAERARTFLLTELGDALDDPVVSARTQTLDAEGLIELLDEVRQAREVLPRSIGDPAGLPIRRVREVFEDIDRQLAVLAPHLARAGDPNRA
jgi:protein-tyrosine phosphatase